MSADAHFVSFAVLVLVVLIIGALNVGDTPSE